MEVPASGPVTLRTNLADYPVSKALKEGRVNASPIVKLDFCGPLTAHDGFKDMVRRELFDVGELAIVTYLQARSYGKPYAALPLPISGRPQHHCIGFNLELGELKPKDIEGRKVGVRTYTQTTGLWARGVLQHECGVDLDKVTWMTIGEGHLAEYQDPPNCQKLPKGSNLPEMMLKGELAAAILGNDMPKDPRVRTLVPDAMAAGKRWCQREGVIPMNHLFVVHEDLVRKRPDVVRELYRMLAESRAAAPEAAAIIPPLGLEANRKGLQFAIDWSFEQHIIPRRFSVDELFNDVTASLGA
jgi:4,5-dihydroxyphthalate decarboxylase